MDLKLNGLMKHLEQDFPILFKYQCTESLRDRILRDFQTIMNKFFKELDISLHTAQSLYLLQDRDLLFTLYNKASKAQQKEYIKEFNLIKENIHYAAHRSEAYKEPLRDS